MAGNVFEWTISAFPAGDAEWNDLQRLLGHSKFSHRWFSIKGGSFNSHRGSDLFFKNTCAGAGLMIWDLTSPGFFDRVKDIG